MSDTSLRDARNTDVVLFCRLASSRERDVFPPCYLREGCDPLLAHPVNTVYYSGRSSLAPYVVVISARVLKIGIAERSRGGGGKLTCSYLYSPFFEKLADHIAAFRAW